MTATVVMTSAALIKKKDGDREGIQRFLSLPTTWPLARLTFPIRDLRKQMETLLQTYCFEIEVTCGPLQDFCKEFSRTLRKAWWISTTNAALLTQKFWVQAVSTELLCASSRIFFPALPD